MRFICLFFRHVLQPVQVVKWFWSIVREDLDEPTRASLLRFSTGSGRIPATGFEHLVGYAGQQQCFTLEPLRVAAADGGGGGGGGGAAGLRALPTAATCFNALKLPESPAHCTSRAELKRKLMTAMEESRGFEEDAL